MRDVGQRAAEVGDGVAQAADRRERALALLGGAGVAGGDDRDRLAVDGLGQERRRRRGRQVEDRRQLVGQAGRGPVGVERGDVGGALAGEDHDAAVDHRADRLRASSSSAVTTPKLPPPPRSPQSSSGSPSAPARTSRPSAVTTSALTRWSQARPCLRTSQPMPPPRVKPDDAGGRDQAAGGRQPEGLRLGVEVLPQQAGLGDDAARAGIDAGALHHRQVDDDALGGGEAGDRVRAAADGDLEALAAGQLDGRA